MNQYEIIEIVSVVLSIVFLVLLMRENRWCWPFGILGSALGAFLFVAPGAEVKLYSEAILYSYYVWVGIYGWYRWNKGSKGELAIQVWGIKKHVIAIGVGAVVAPALGFFMDRFLESNNPYMDAFTTVFSFIASYMQAEKVLSSWHFWIVINGLSIWLYFHRGLEIYSLLMVVYFVLSAVGLLQWRKAMKAV